MDNGDTLSILKQLEQGNISAEEAGARLDAPAPVERDYAPAFEETGTREWIRRMWVYPLLVGLVIVAFGSWVIYSTVHANALWFVCGLPILLLGTLVLALAASAESGHWLYVNIQGSQNHPRSFRLGIPFPLGLARVALWLVRLLGLRPPSARIKVHGHGTRGSWSWADADALLSALDRELQEHRGISVDVDDLNERIQVYIV